MTPASKPKASSLDREARGDAPSPVRAPSGLISLLLKEGSSAHSIEKFSDQQLQLAARLYYVDGLSQVEVARFIKVSQAKISRLLAVARERGIVRISVADYNPRRVDLEARISSVFPTVTAAVIKDVEGGDQEENRRALAHFGAAWVASLIPPRSVIAIAGGRALCEVVDRLPADPGRQLTVIQAMGSVDSNVGLVDASELGRRLAQRMGGNFHTINTPAFVPTRATRDAFLGLDQIRSVWTRLAEAKVALIGIGSLENSVFVDRNTFSANDLATLTRSGAVGEICGRFFDPSGRECDSPWRERVIGIELETLRRIPQVIAISAGRDRHDAIRAAIKGGLVKSLLIDEAAALALLSKPA